MDTLVDDHYSGAAESRPTLTETFESAVEDYRKLLRVMDECGVARQLPSITIGDGGYASIQTAGTVEVARAMGLDDPTGNGHWTRLASPYMTVIVKATP